MKVSKTVFLAMMIMALALGGSVLARGGDDVGADDSGGTSGRSSSSPRSSDDSSSSGMEIEIEHGIQFLKPHGGENAASLAARAAAVGNEVGMEVEVEHGVAFLKPHGGNAARDLNLEKRVSGRILLQVEKNGEAWFVEPMTKKIVFLGKPGDALQTMREFGLGITNRDLARIPEAGDDRSNDPLATKLSGHILLQVEDHGQAWFVDPVSHTRHSLGRPDDALKVMRNLGLGITNANLAKLANMK